MLTSLPQAIRKKIESELSRKRTISTTSFRNQKGRKPTVAKGTVAALKPSPALTVPHTITVSDASQLCAAKRTDCVLVVDEEEGLCGIFTAKDLAYRVRIIFFKTTKKKMIRRVSSRSRQKDSSPGLHP